MLMVHVTSAVIVLAVFIIVVGLVTTERINRAASAITGAVACIFVMYFIEGKQFIQVVGYIFGATESPPNSGQLVGNWEGLHALVLIIAMMLILQVCRQSGLFQYVAFSIVKVTGRDPVRLLVTICLVSVAITSVMNNTIAVMIMVPLIVMMGRILDIDTKPYILCTGIVVSLGALFLPVSHVVNILIFTHEGIPFDEFFLNAGMVGIALVAPTIVLFYFVYRKRLAIPARGTDVLKAFDTWSLVPDRKVMYRSLAVLVGVLVCFFLNLNTFLPADTIALAAAILLLVITRVNAEEVISKIDIQLVFYLVGIFVITGSMNDLGVMNVIAQFFAGIGFGNSYFTYLAMLWIPGIMSGFTEPTAITKLMIPVVNNVATSTGIGSKSLFFTMNEGVVLGDNLTVFGTNILVVNLSKQYGHPITAKEITKIGFFTVILQFFILSAVYAFIIEPRLNWPIGMALLLGAGVVLALYLAIKRPAEVRATGRKVLGWASKKWIATTAHVKSKEGAPLSVSPVKPAPADRPKESSKIVAEPKDKEKIPSEKDQKSKDLDPKATK
jgi:Na+/H+ antiporter NhaD/arsenite permease-like protein